jgi:hypothetical protein
MNVLVGMGRRDVLWVVPSTLRKLCLVMTPMQDVFAVKFNDLSAYTHLQLLVRSFIPYAGFKVRADPWWHTAAPGSTNVLTPLYAHSTTRAEGGTPAAMSPPPPPSHSHHRLRKQDVHVC